MDPKCQTQTHITDECHLQVEVPPAARRSGPPAGTAAERDRRATLLQPGRPGGHAAGPRARHRQVRMLGRLSYRSL